MKKKKNELPSGNIRKKVFMGYEILEDGSKKKIYKSVTGSTYTEVNSKVALLKGERADTKNTTILFKDARETYIKISEPVLSPSTIRGYKQMNTYFSELDSYDVKMIDKQVMQSWVNSFSADHSPKTVRNAYGLARKVLKEYGFDIQAKLPAKERKEIFVPSDDEVKKIIEHFRSTGDTDMLIAVCLAAFGTLRRSEICGLTADDVKGNVIHVHQSKVINSDKEIITKSTVKNFSSDRYIDTVPQFVIDILPKSGSLVSISPDNITNRFHRGLIKCGIEPFRFHSLRAYSASFMHTVCNFPDSLIMKIGGWTSIETLTEIYRGTVPNYEQDLKDKFTNAISRVYKDCFE